MTDDPKLTVAVDVLPLAGAPSGVGAMCGQMLRALMDRPDVEMTAYAVAARAHGVRAVVPKGLGVRTMMIPTRIANGLWRVDGLPSLEMITGRVSVVHGTNYVVPPTRHAAAIVTVHDLTAWRWPELCSRPSLSYPPLVRRAIGRGALVHTPSEFVAREVVELTGVDESRVRAIHWGPPTFAAPAVGDLRSKSPFPFPYVLAIGTVEPRKDYPTLVRAFAEIAGDLTDLRLVIAGADGWGTEALDREAAATPVAGRIVRLGYVDTVTRAELLAHALALAYPSRYEGFGLPPLEAMAAGVPVVATDAGAIPEIVGDGALVVRSGDVADLAEGLRKVVGDAEVRDALIANGRERLTRFSWVSSAAAMTQLYRDAVVDRG